MRYCRNDLAPARMGQFGKKQIGNPPRDIRKRIAVKEKKRRTPMAPLEEL
jgi:hypothetical protein